MTNLAYETNLHGGGKPSLREMANAIRALSMDAVEKANSGHPRHADGHGGRCGGAVHQVHEVRRERAQLAGPRPLRAFGRPRLDAALFGALPHRLSGRHYRGLEEFPPARQQDRGPSGIRSRAGHRNDHRPARPGHHHRRRHGHRRAHDAGALRRFLRRATTPM